MILTEDIVKRNVERLVSKGEYDEADKISREYARKVFESKVKRWSLHELSKFLLKSFCNLLCIHKLHELNTNRALSIGSTLSWIDVIKDGYRIFEVGTGLGTTCYAVICTSEVEEYITVEPSGEALAVALFKNPLNVCRKALWNENVKILLGDPRFIISSMRRDVFDHVICKGVLRFLRIPPSTRLLKRLVKMLKNNGTIALLVEGNSELSNKIHHTLTLIQIRVQLVKTLNTSTSIFYGIKAL